MDQLNLLQRWRKGEVEKSVMFLTTHFAGATCTVLLGVTESQAVETSIVLLGGLHSISNTDVIRKLLTLEDVFVGFRASDVKSTKKISTKSTKSTNW